MAQRLNKRLVVGLTVTSMLVIAGAGILLVRNLPGRDPQPSVDQAEKLVAAADKIRGELDAIDDQLTTSSDEAAKEGLREKRSKLLTELQEKYVAASKYYGKAYARALAGGDVASANTYMVKAGEMMLSSGDQQQAVRCWRGVLLNNPKHEVAQQKIVSVLLDQAELYGRNWWSDVRKEAERLVADDFAPANVVGQNALGRALVESSSTTLEDMRKGGEYLLKAWQADKTNPKFAESLAGYHVRVLEREISQARQDGKFDEVAQLENQREVAARKAGEVYDSLIEAIKSLPENSEAVTLAWRKRGQFHMVMRDMARAELEQKKQGRAAQSELDRISQRVAEHSKLSLESVEAALAHSPKDVESLVLLGVYWRSSPPQAVDAAEIQKEVEGYHDKAKELFELAIKADPDSFDPYVELQSYYTRKATEAFAAQDKTGMVGNVGKASQVLEARIKRGASRTGIYQWRNRTYMGIIRWQLFLVNTWQAERLRELPGNAATTKQEIAPIVAQLRQVRQDYVADATDGEKDPRAIFMKARLEVLDNQPEDAIKSLLELQDLIAPGDLWVQTKMHLAQLYLQLDAPGPAVEALQAVIKFAPSNDGAMGMLALALASLPDRQGDAEDIAKRTLALNPENTHALNALGRLYEKQKNWKELERIQAHLRGKRSQTETELLEASLLLARGNDPDNKSPQLIAEAQQKLRGILQSNPSHPQALRTLISTLAQDDSNSEEVNALLANATADLDKKLAEANAANPPNEQELKQLQAAKNSIAFLSVVADPKADAQEKVARTEAIIRQNSDPFVVAVDMYRLCMGAPGRQAEAIQHLKEAYRIKPEDPGIVEMLFRASIATIKDEKGDVVSKPDWELAQQLVKRMVDLGIDRSDGHYYQGQLLFARNDLKDNYAQAEREFREGLKVFPVHSNGHAWLGRSLLAQNRIEEAQAAYQQAFAQNPLNGMAALYLAKIAAAKGDETAKAKYLEHCKQLNVSDAWTQEQEQLAQDAADPRAGIARREEIRKNRPDDLPNLIALSELYARVEEFDKAKSLMAECYALQPKNLTYLQSYVNFLRNVDPPDYATAEAALRKAFESFGEDEKDLKGTAQLLLAAHMEILANRQVPNAPSAEEIETAYMKAAELSAGPSVMADIAAHYQRANQPAKCEEWLRKSITQAQADQNARIEMNARRSLIQLMLNIRDFKRSADLQHEIEAYRAKFQDSFGLLAMSEFATMVGRETNATEFVTQYITATAGMEKALGFYRRGAMNYRRGDWDLAISDLREAKALTQDGFQYQHRILLARCLQITGQTDQAIAELSGILSQDRTILTAAEELYGVYMAGKRYDEAEAFIMPAFQLAPKSPRWIGLLAEIAAARDDQARAIQRGKETVQNAEFAPQMVDTLLSHYLRFKQFDDMLRYVDTQLPQEAREQPGVQARVAMAHLGAGAGGQAKAEQAYAKMLAQAAQFSPQVLVILLDMPKVIGMETALQFVRDQATKHPDNPIAGLAAAYLTRASGDEEGFTTAIEALLTKLPANEPTSLQLRIEALQGLAGSYYQRKQLEPARKRYEELLEIAPERSASRAICLNNLAYLLVEDIKEPATALPYAEEAARLMPNQTNVLDTLGWNLVLLGEYDRGISTIRAAIYAASAQDLVQLAAVHYHAAVALQKRSQQSRQRGQNTPADQDLAEAKLDCSRAHGLLVMVRNEGDGLMAKIAALGKELGLTLDEKLPAAAQP